VKLVVLVWFWLEHFEVGAEMLKVASWFKRIVNTFPGGGDESSDLPRSIVEHLS